jgi:AcrR family transcriptional regulator
MNQADDSTHSPDERAQIIGAAWQVLEQSGFEGFKVQLVLRRAGVSARSFYSHFADKDALLIALLQDESARAAAILTSTVAKVPSDDPAGQVVTWISGVLGAAVDPLRVRRARLFTTQQAVMRQFPGEAAAAMALLIEPLRGAIARGIATGVFPWADAERDAAMIRSLTGAELTRALGEPEASVDDVVNDVAGFALRALGVRP